jgi:hypothetical protein
MNTVDRSLLKLEDCLRHSNDSKRFLPAIRTAPLLLLIAVAITGAVAVVGSQLESAYFATHPYIYDPVSYMYISAEKFVRLQTEGLLPALIYELKESLYPWRSIPLLLVAPNLLAHPLGHMATSLPLFFLYVLILGWSTYKRGGSVFYAAASMVVTAAIPGLFDPRFGVGQFWLDFASAWALGVCYLCALNHQHSLHKSWLILAAAAFALAAWSRYVSVVYILLICGPIFLTTLALAPKRNRLTRKETLTQCGLLAATSLLLAGPFLISRFASVFIRYTEVGYGLNQTVAESFNALSGFLFSTLTTAEFLLLLCAAFVMNAAFAEKKDWTWVEFASRVWGLLALPVFVIFVLRAPQNGYVLWHEIPVACAALLLPCGRLGGRWAALCLSLSVAISAAALTAYNIGRTVEKIHKTEPEVMELKQLDTMLARHIAQLPPHVTWSPFFAEYHVMPNMVAFYSSGKLPNIPIPGLFTEHQSFWVQDYKTNDPQQIKEKVYSALDEKCGLAVVFDSAEGVVRAEKLGLLDNKISTEVSSYVLHRLSQSSNWHKISVINTKKFGPLAIYKRDM